jgi:hypothetical protein
MRCLQCGEKIGWLRLLTDRRFCSAQHRRKAGMNKSARLARDLEDDDASWLYANSGRANKRSFGPGIGILLVVFGTLLLLLLPSEKVLPESVQASYLPPATIGSRLQRLLPAKGSLSLREDFGADLRNWQGGVGSLASGWQRVGTSMQVGDLRLWKPTLTLRDYNVEFGTQVESRAVSWAFRAADRRNYYATKLALSRDGSQVKRAEIVRYAVVDGKASDRVRLPIPLSIVSASSVYDIKVGVQGSRFTTVVNGQLVDSWADNRLKKGGVGFFSDPGERAKLHWVSISERENFLRRFLSFGLILSPGLLVEEGGLTFSE